MWLLTSWYCLTVLPPHFGAWRPSAGKHQAWTSPKRVSEEPAVWRLRLNQNRAASQQHCMNHEIFPLSKIYLLLSWRSKWKDLGKWPTLYYCTHKCKFHRSIQKRSIYIYIYIYIRVSSRIYSRKWNTSQFQGGFPGKTAHESKIEKCVGSMNCAPVNLKYHPWN